MRKIKKLLREVKKNLKPTLLTSYYAHFYYRSKIRQKTVLLESRNGLDVAGNIFYLMQELCRGDYGIKKVYLSVCPQTRKRAQALLSRYDIKGVHLVAQGSLKYYKLLARVKYIFTDTSLPRAYIKKEGQIFTNTWHGTPLKKMGKYNIPERHSMGNIQRSLLFSDYLIFPNDYMREKMLESYNIDTSLSGEILCEGYPRNSVLFETENAEKLKTELGFSDKKLYVYMPTWKAENMGKTMQESLDRLRNTLLEIDKKLSDGEILLLKLHPLVRANADVSGFEHIKAFPEQYEAYEVLSACDALVTDYSSVFFDFACSRKKIVLFTPDEDEYDIQRGFYFPLSELPFIKTKTAQELVSALRDSGEYDYSEFVEKFCTYDRPNAAKYILSHIIKGEDCCKIMRAKKSEKERVLFYCGALLQNGLTASFKNLLGLIDLGEREYFFAFKQSAFAKHPERLDAVDGSLKLYSISSGITLTILEAFAFMLYYRFNIKGGFVKRYVNRAYKRDFKKHFSHLKMDHIVHFSGYDEYIIALLSEFDAKKTIFVHSDMKMELSTRGNQHRPTLESAYRNYDKVAVVTPAMIEPTASISGKKDNIVVVGNSFNAQLVKEKGDMPIEFQSETRNSIHHPGGIEGILSEKGTKIITVGRYSVEKQHNMLIDAFCEYNEKNPESFLILIGGAGKLYAKTVAYANSKPCSKNIAFIYSIQNPMPIIKRCDLFVLPSKYESLGLVLFEADALGVPSICTQMDGPADIINEFGGTMVENSAQGILNGFQAFENGKVKPMNIDFKAYNKEALEQYNNLFT
ncbi:MAG: CDP-glycerol glycerophosphotransferase family protein [Oscillospiraceae bacterium]|nr:CDP-glycerol glycerophosphotransferase family protein [Oscillospiraceae bacterium]